MLPSRHRRKRFTMMQNKNMNRLLLATFLFLSDLCINGQTILQIRPDVITECSSFSLGRATIVWNYPGTGPVQVRVGPAAVPMTGLQPSIGSGDTGNWVSDGLLFTLVDSGGQELARATARVKCGPFPDPI